MTRGCVVVSEVGCPSDARLCGCECLLGIVFSHSLVVALVSCYFCFNVHAIVFFSFFVVPL